MIFVMEPIGVIRTPFAEGDEIRIQPPFVPDFDLVAGVHAGWYDNRPDDG